MSDNSQKGSTFRWFLAALFVAILAVVVIYYIGWFDNNTHVDTPAGDNVEQQYTLDEAGADQPGEAEWQNAAGQSLREVITEPAAETQTPPAE